jgi:DNA invertase Pin-like site-specific DNA recombinase
MLTVLAGLAEFERELIRARTGEGRERAKARGVKHPAAHYSRIIRPSMRKSDCQGTSSKVVQEAGTSVLATNWFQVERLGIDASW